jgi:CheY-like chemotaxis protein
LTAGIFIEEKDKCLESGMNDYISKPITLHDLETVLLKWVKVFSFKILLKSNSFFITPYSKSFISQKHKVQ